jgi:prepilin-type N-terminal cleavage/methylation domain-containing protein
MNRKAFTLIEIMIVVAIVALLAGIAVPALLRARMSANETSAQAVLKSFATACESYAAANAALYPSQVENLTNGSPPYFSYDLETRNRERYVFTVDFTSGNDGYTLTAAAKPNAGNWDYQITTGAVFKRSKPGQDNWQAY